MGRSKASQRDKKAEKAKVKLKGHTTKFLPKGLNVTKTAFKVRKIVLQEQLRTQDGSQPLTKRKLNVKEVLSRLQHYSSSHREEGLGGLGELLGQMDRDQLASHLSAIIDNLTKLCLDEDSKVRRLSAHILTSVFSLVSETQLLPFCAVLGSYLSCAMTHIQLGVQEDSLLLLDALLEKAPALAAASVHQLLPCVLDMISRSRSDHQSGRQLSLQLSSNFISSIWRAKVFGRLQALLVVSLLHRKGSGVQETKVLNKAHFSSVSIIVDPNKQYTFPLYSGIYSTPVCLSKIFQKSTASSNQLLDDAAQLRNFVESIMPLMLDSWMEVNPLSLKSNKKAEDNGLTVEPALILHCVLEIIDLLWQHLVLWEKENARFDLTEWFKNTYAKDVNRFLGKGFPYVPRVLFSLDDDEEGESQGSGRKRFKAKGDSGSKASLFKLASPFLLKDKDEPSCTQAIAKCVLQNLALSHLLVTIMKSPSSEIKEKILEILTAYLNQWGGSLLVWSDHLIRALRSVFEKSSAWTCDLNPLLFAVVSRYYRSLAKKQTSHQTFASKLCDLLVEVSLHPKFEHLLRYESFSSWFVQLPSSLSHGDVTIDKLCVLNKLACQNNAVFLKGLQSAFTSILDAACNFPLLEGDNQTEKEAGLASLFYWVDWNKEQVSALKEVLGSKKVSVSLTKKIINILLLRQENSQVLADASWLVECI